MEKNTIQLQARREKLQQLEADSLLKVLFAAMYTMNIDTVQLKAILKNMRTKRRNVPVKCGNVSFVFDIPSEKIVRNIAKAITMGENEMHHVVSYIREVQIDGVTIPLTEDPDNWVTPVYHLMLQIKGLIDILLPLLFIDEVSLNTKLSKKLYNEYLSTTKDNPVEAPHPELYSLLVNTMKQNKADNITIGLSDGTCFATFAYPTLAEKNEWLTKLVKENIVKEGDTFDISDYITYQLLMSTTSLEIEGKQIERTADAYMEALSSAQFRELEDILYDFVYLEEHGWQQHWLEFEEVKDGNITS